MVTDDKPIRYKAVADFTALATAQRNVREALSGGDPHHDEPPGTGEEKD